MTWISTWTDTHRQIELATGQNNDCRERERGWRIFQSPSPSEYPGGGGHAAAAGPGNYPKNNTGVQIWWVLISFVYKRNNKF